MRSGGNTFHLVTAEPTERTTPTTSWPGTMGKMAGPGHSAQTWWRSEWHCDREMQGSHQSGKEGRSQRAAPSAALHRAPMNEMHEARKRVTGLFHHCYPPSPKGKWVTRRHRSQPSLCVRRQDSHEKMQRKHANLRCRNSGSRCQRREPRAHGVRPPSS